MNYLFLLPPLAFLLILIVAGALFFLTKRLSAKGVYSPGKGEPYACGQEVATGRIQPNYAEFFPFAFFFTIMHVTALAVCTAPANAVWLAAVFIAIAALAIIILFRKED